MDPSVEKLLALLAEAKVQFVVVGGVAVILNGFHRRAKDVDLLVDASGDNIERLLTALASYGEGGARQLSLADFTEKEGVVRIFDASEKCQIDLYTTLSGLSCRDLLGDAAWWGSGENQFAYASLRSLLWMKMDSLRAKDRVDAFALRELVKDSQTFA